MENEKWGLDHDNKPGIHATRNGKSLGRVGKILQKVSRVQEVVRIRSKCESKWEKDRGRERK